MGDAATLDEAAAQSAEAAAEPAAAEEASKPAEEEAHDAAKAVDFMVRAHRERQLAGDDVLRVLHLDPHHRSDEDLEVLYAHFSHLAFFDPMHTKLRRLHACRYLGAKTVSLGRALFSEGDVGDEFYILLHGRVECRFAARPEDGVEARVEECVGGDSFGEQGLHGENEGRRDATVVAMESSVLATMARADYLRVTEALTEKVLEVLAIPPGGNDRTALQLRLVRSLFHGTEFFQKLHFALLQERCCEMMALVKLEKGDVLYHQKKTAHNFYIIIKGTLGVYVQGLPDEERASNETEYGTLVGEFEDGHSLGEHALVGKTNAERQEQETVVCHSTEPTFVAKLSRTAFVDVTSKLEHHVYHALQTRSYERTDAQIALLFAFMRDEEFFSVLQLDGMRRQCCRAMVMQRVGNGEVLFSQGDRGDTFHILMRGSGEHDRL